MFSKLFNDILINEHRRRARRAKSAKIIKIYFICQTRPSKSGGGVKADRVKSIALPVDHCFSGCFSAPTTEIWKLTKLAYT